MRIRKIVGNKKMYSYMANEDLRLRASRFTGARNIYRSMYQFTLFDRPDALGKAVTMLVLKKLRCNLHGDKIKLKVNAALVSDIQGFYMVAGRFIAQKEILGRFKKAKVYFQEKGFRDVINMDFKRIKTILTQERTPNFKRYVDEVKKFPLLLKEEMLVLLWKKKWGSKEARDRLIKGNLWRVVRIAEQYCRKGRELLDLIQAGNEALVETIDRLGFATPREYGRQLNAAIVKAIKP